MPGLEYPPSHVYVPYVPEPVYPEFMPPEDDVLPSEEQPLPDVVSPTADSPGYITKSDTEEDPKEDDEDPKEDPADYPNDRDDEEEEESSGDDADDEEEDEDEDEEEEHLALADSVPPPTCRTTARMSIRDQTPIPFPSVTKVDRFLAISTLPPSPLTSYSSPLPQIPSPPLPVSSPLLVSPPPLHASPTHPLGYKAAMIRLRVELPSTSHLLPLPSPMVLPHTKASVAMMRDAAPSTYILASRSETPPSGTPPLLPIPLPTPSPPLLLPSIDCLRFEVGESSSVPTARPTIGFRADYRFVGTLDDEIRRDPERERVRALRTAILAQHTKIRELREIDCRRQTQLTEALTLMRTLQTQGLEYGRYGVSKVLDTAYRGFLGAQIRRIFLDGYGVLVVRTMGFDSPRVKGKVEMTKRSQNDQQTNKKREKDKETRARVRNQPKITAGSARHSKK
ncbi:hypothetical protein Tco_0688326 [Tanacetum coccineum]